MKVSLSVFALILIVTSCKYDDLDSLKYNSIITGYDMRDCACCGGLMINFENQSQSYQGKFYLIDNLPTDLGIDNNTTFPIYAYVTYTELTKCSGNIIRIDYFRKIK